MKRIADEIVSMTWSVVGAGFVLMTVSGPVFRTGMILTSIGVGVQLLGLLLRDNSEEDDNE